MKHLFVGEHVIVVIRMLRTGGFDKKYCMGITSRFHWGSKNGARNIEVRAKHFV